MKHDWAKIAKRRREGATWSTIAQEEDMRPNVLRTLAGRHGLTHQHDARASDDDPQFDINPPEPPTLEELFSAARENIRLTDSVDPILNHSTVSWKRGPVAVIVVSCAHLGSRFTFYEQFDSIFRHVLDTPRLYWLSLGDDVEGFLPSFVDGSAVLEQALVNPKVQRAMLAAVLDKLAERKKLLAGCSSNHGGAWARRKTGDDPIKDMYRERKVPFFDGKALLSLHVGEQEYHMGIAHSFPGSSMYNPVHAQRRAGLFDFPTADVIVQGHKHNYAVTEMSLPPHEYDAGLRASYIQWLVQVGTAKTGPDRYSMEGWARGVLEWPIMVFREDRHEVTVTRRLQTAQYLLKGGE